MALPAHSRRLLTRFIFSLEFTFNEFIDRSFNETRLQRGPGYKGRLIFFPLSLDSTTTIYFENPSCQYIHDNQTALIVKITIMMAPKSTMVGGILALLPLFISLAACSPISTQLGERHVPYCQPPKPGQHGCVLQPPPPETSGGHPPPHPVVNNANSRKPLSKNARSPKLPPRDDPHFV